MRGILKVIGVVVLVSFALAPAARAGEYHVYSCRTPAGEAAPADGWSGAVAGNDDSATDTCASGGALTAALRGGVKHETNMDLATWELSVPAFDTLVGATLWRAADADGGEGVNATYETWLAGPTQSSPFDSCVYEFGCTTGVGDQAQPLAEANRVVVPAVNLGAHLYVNASCEGSFSGHECPAGAGDPNGYAAAVYLYAADVLLEQSAGPTAGNVGGELASAATVAGTSDVIFTASDPGAGVWEATFSVDGKVVQSTVPDENGGRCRDVGQSADGLPAFLYLQPCPASESVDVGFDTTGLSNGEHHLIVSVLDAAGNSAPVLDREIDVENPVPAPASAPAGQPGVGAAPAVVKPRVTPRGRARLTLKVRPRRVVGNRRVRFSGRLWGGSIPRGGKLLVVEGRRSRRGAWIKFDVIRTGAQGRFHAGYRFAFLGPGRWEIRVLAEAEAGYPFGAVASRVARVRVG